MFKQYLKAQEELSGGIAEETHIPGIDTYHMEYKGKMKSLEILESLGYFCEIGTCLMQDGAFVSQNEGPG